MHSAPRCAAAATATAGSATNPPFAQTPLAPRRAQGFLDSRIDIIAEGAKDDDARFWIFSKAFPLGDQDVMNAVFRKMPGWLAVVPPEFNVCRDGDAAPGRAPCILHMCGARLSPEDSGRAAPLACDDAWRAAADLARKTSLGYTS